MKHFANDDCRIPRDRRKTLERNAAPGQTITKKMMGNSVCSSFILTSPPQALDKEARLSLEMPH